MSGGMRIPLFIVAGRLQNQEYLQAVDTAFGAVCESGFFGGL